MRILIVGAGVAGLALACALRRTDCEVEVVERSPQWRPIGAGLFLPANAVRASRDLGVGDSLAAKANPIATQGILTHRGRALAHVAVERIWGAGAPCLAIHRADLQQILLDHCEAPLRLGRAVTGVADGPAPRVRFADGSEGTYDLVVGADGIRSTVRELVFGGPAPRFLGQVSWRFVADGFPGMLDWTARLGRGTTFLTVALGGGRVYCYADVTAADPSAYPGDSWRELFAGHADPVPRLLEQAGPAHRALVEEVPQPTEWTAHRVVLVGDAAHAASPNMAEGAAMAMEDALVLAEVLTAGRGVDDALATYERRRAARVEWVHRQTHRRDRTRSLPPVIRNAVLRFAAGRIFAANYKPLRDRP